jgi:hypothetical protein
MGKRVEKADNARNIATRVRLLGVGSDLINHSDNSQTFLKKMIILMNL